MYFTIHENKFFKKLNYILNEQYCIELQDRSHKNKIKKWKRSIFKQCFLYCLTWFNFYTT